jgi:transposase
VIKLGVDAHKQLHVAVALDDAGRPLAHWRGENSPTGWVTLHDWAIALGSPRQWGIEGAWNYGRGLAQYLVTAAETVYEINPRWTAVGRKQARRTGKSDALDAQAIAHYVRQEAPHLPSVAADDATAVLDLLTSQRETALAEARRLGNQLHALLLQIDPQYKKHLPALTSHAAIAALEHYQAPASASGLLAQERAAIVRRLAQRLRLATEQAEELERLVRARIKDSAFMGLTSIWGVGMIIAGTLAGILGPGCRFANDAQLAAYAGVAPLEASSASLVRHRLNRGGNRRLNMIVHMVALTQLRSWEPARAYVGRRLAEGKTRREAMRALKRYLVRAIWQAWKRCIAAESVGATAAA